MEIDSEAFIQEVLNVHNKLRTDPKHYISALEDMASCFNGNMFSKPGRITLVTNEGVAAVNEAIEFLKKQSAIGKLSLSKALSKAAQDHASDIGKNNMAGHTGSDGSSMGDRVERYCNWSTALGENCQFGDTPDGAHEAVLQWIRIRIYKI